MKKKFMCWWGGGYLESVEMRDLAWFDVDRGYTPFDCEIMIPKLKVGETHVMDNGDHIVTRVK